MMKMIYEILDEVDRAPTSEDKVNILKFNRSPALAAVVQSAFHPNIQWFIKERIPYKQSIIPAGLGYSNIASTLRKFYLFREGNPELSPNLTIQKRNMLLTEMLESMEAREADVVLNMMMKNLNIKGLTYSVAKEAYPDLLP